MNGTSQRPSVQNVHAAFQELHNSLKEAYWVASTIGNKDKIIGLQEVVFDIITELNRADLSSRTQAYEALKAKVDETNNRLERLKGEIDRIIHAIGVASRVVGAIDKVADIVKKFFIL